MASNKVKDLIKSINMLSKDDRDYLKENVFSAIENAQKAQEKRTWAGLCEWIEEWKRVAELDGIIIESGEMTFKLVLDPEEPGGFSLEEF